MTAIALSCAALSGCVPSNAAVGDTQSPNTAVAHSTEDRDSLSIAMIGSDDVTADSMAMDAMEAGKLKPVYITVSGTVDAQSTAQQGVRDMAQRKADLIIIAGIDVDEANADTYPGYQRWDLGLSYAFPGPTPITVHAMIDNITNRRYATSVNTVGYAPGAPRMIRIGAQLGF